MDNVKNLLFNKKNEISEELDTFLDVVKRTIDKKNKEIVLLKKEIEDTYGMSKTVSLRPTTLIKNALELLIMEKRNNILSKRIIKKNFKIRRINRKINQKPTLSAEGMTAFKVIAMELEEEKKDNEKNKSALENIQKNRDELADKIDFLETKFENMNAEIKNLEEENDKLKVLNKTQLEKIEKLTNELKNKEEKVADLKNYFLEILVDYNDIIQEAE